MELGTEATLWVMSPIMAWGFSIALDNEMGPLLCQHHGVMHRRQTSFRDAEITIKINILRGRVQRGVGRGFEKRVNRGPTLNLIVGLNHRKNRLLESRIFFVVAFS